jgi:hypothetical protein
MQEGTSSPLLFALAAGDLAAVEDILESQQVRRLAESPTHYRSRIAPRRGSRLGW